MLHKGVAHGSNFSCFVTLRNHLPLPARRVPDDLRLISGKPHLFKTSATSHRSTAIVLARANATRTDAISKNLMTLKRKQRADNFALKIRREIDGMKADKLSQRQIIQELNRNEYKAAPGKARSQCNCSKSLSVWRQPVWQIKAGKGCFCERQKIQWLFPKLQLRCN